LVYAKAVALKASANAAPARAVLLRIFIVAPSLVGVPFLLAETSSDTEALAI